MLAEPLLKIIGDGPNARYPHHFCGVCRPPCGESQKVTNEPGSAGDGGGSTLSPLQRNSSFQTKELRETGAAAHPPTDKHSAEERAGIPETARSLSPVCSRMEKTLSPSSPPAAPTPRPQSAFLLPPSWSRSLSSKDFSQQPSSPTVDPAPASFKFHSVIFIFGDFSPPPLSMFIHDCGSEREIRSRALSWPRGPPGL